MLNKFVLKRGSEKEKLSLEFHELSCWKSNFFPRKRDEFTDVFRFLPKLCKEKSLDVAGS